MTIIEGKTISVPEKELAQYYRRCNGHGLKHDSSTPSSANRVDRLGFRSPDAKGNVNLAL